MAADVPPIKKRRRWPWVVLGSLVLLIGGVLAAIAWLLMTPSGLDRLARTAVEFSDGQLHIEGAEGRLTGPLQIRSLSLNTPTLQLQLDALALDWTPAALFERRIHIKTLSLDSVRFASAPTDEASAPPSLPDSLVLPVAVEIDRLTLGRLAQESFPFDPAAPAASALIEALALSLTTGSEAHRLVLESVSTPVGPVRGELSLGVEAPHATELAATLAGQFGEHALDVALAAKGPLAALDTTATVTREATQVVVVTQVKPFEVLPVERIAVTGERINPADWAPGAPAAQLSVESTLTLSGEMSAPQLSGPLSVRNADSGAWDAGKLPLQQLDTQLQLSAAQVVAAELRALLAGKGSIAGAIDWAPSDDPAGQLNAKLTLADINLRALDTRLPDSRMKGQLDAAANAGKQTVSGTLSDPRLQATLAVNHADSRVTVETLALKSGKSRVVVKGHLTTTGVQAFEAELKLSALDPKPLWAEAPSATINGDLKIAGQLEDLQARVNYRVIDSVLDGKSLAGEGALRWRGERVSDVVAWLRFAGNRVDAAGAWGAKADVLDVRVDAPDLAALGLDVSGVARLEGQITGGLKTPAGHFTASAEKLRLPGDLRLQSLNADVSLGEGLEGPISVAIGGQDLRNQPKGPALLERFALTADGRRQQHVIELSVAAGSGEAIDARLRGALSEAMAWQGRVESLALAGRLPLKLMAPAELEASGTRVRLSRAELKTDDGGQLTLEQTDWTPGTVTAKGRMSGLMLGLETRPDKRPKRGQGELQLGGDWDVQLGETARGTVHVFRESGDLVLTGDTVLRFGLTELDVLANIDNTQLAVSLNAKGDTLGTLAGSATARLKKGAAGWQLDGQGPLLGSAVLDIPGIGWFGALVSPAVRTDGKLRTEFSLSGTPDAPVGVGRVTGDDLAIEIADEGLRLTGGKLIADFDANQLRIDTMHFISPSRVAPRDRRVGYAALTQTPGQLSASGAMSLKDGDGQIRFEADRLPIFQRADRWLAVSGKGSIETRWDAPALEASFRADGGYLEFAKTPAPSLSDDVVILGDEPSVSNRALKARIEVDLGEQLYLSALGLDTRLAGKLLLQANAGEALRATGTVKTAGGSFEGYGQKLDITRGRVNFIGPMDNPGLDVLAVRSGLEVEAGVSITGTVRRPRIQLVSTPNVPDAEKLSWIVLGRAPEGTGGADLALLLPAAQALLGGPGGGVTQELASGLGLDEISLGQGELNSVSRGSTSSVVGGGSRIDSGATTGGRVLTLGKRLSATTTLSFEQSLSGVAQIVKLTHQLTRSLSVVGRAGTDNAVDLQWSMNFR